MRDKRSLLSDDRGVAMVEGVIVVPFFLIIWMGLIALFSLFDARLEAQLAAGDAAMQMASGGMCKEADMSLDDMDQTSEMDTGMDSEESDMISNISGSQPFAWSHARTTVSRDAENIPESFGGPTITVKGKRTLMCNMKPVDGLMDMVAGLVSDLLGLD